MVVRASQLLWMIALLLFLFGCENEPVAPKPPPGPTYVGDGPPPPPGAGAQAPRKRGKRKSKGKSGAPGGIDWRAVRGPDEGGANVAIPEPNASALWAQASFGHPGKMVSVVNPVTSTVVNEVLLSTWIKRFYYVDIGSAILWNQPLHLLWVEPLPSMPILVARARSSEDVKVLLHDDRITDRRGNLFTFNISLTQTTYVNFEGDHVVLSPHWRDYPLLSKHIASLVEAPPGPLLRYTTHTVEGTEALVRYVRSLNPGDPVLRPLWKALDAFIGGTLPRTAQVELELELDPTDRLHLNARLRHSLPEPPPEPEEKNEEKKGEEKDVTEDAGASVTAAADASSKADAAGEDPPEPPEPSPFAQWLDTTSTPSLRPLLESLPLHHPGSLLIWAFEDIPEHADDLHAALTTFTPFALLPEDLRFTSPAPLTAAHRSRLSALASPLVQMHVQTPAGTVFIARATLRDPKAFDKATRARNTLLQNLAQTDPNLPRFTPLESPLPLEPAPDGLTAYAILPPQPVPPRKPAKAKPLDPLTHTLFVEAVRGDQLYWAVGPGAGAILQKLLGPPSVDATDAWLQEATARTENALLLIDLPPREGSKANIGSLTVNVRAHAEALVLELSMPQQTLAERFAPRP